MLLTRQQAKAQKRNAKRLGQLLKDAKQELQHCLGVIECTAIDQGTWGRADVSYSQEAFSVVEQILAIADSWHQFNQFEIDEKLTQIENRFYQD